MKYKTEIDIELPLDGVIALFDDQNNLYKWQPELVNLEHLSGTAGEVGAKMKMIYKTGKGNRTFEMLETITHKELPSNYSFIFETKGVTNYLRNEFIPITETQTKWIVHNEFKFSGFMAFMALFMKGTFKKHSYKFLVRFKEFAEREG